MEITLVLAIALLVLGPSKLPEIGESLGSTIRELHKAAADVQGSVPIDTSVRPSAAPVAAAVNTPVAPAAANPAPSASSAEPQAGA